MDGTEVYREASTKPGVWTVVTQNAAGYYTTYKVTDSDRVLSSQPGNRTGWGA